LAGIFSRFENVHGEVIRTFGLVTAWREDDERFGHHGPVVIDPRDAATWLGKDAARARGLLAQRQPPVVDRALRRSR
jgi:putative SOS response-associated peptidase YedK